jgi:HD-GYP domain-containing protein (c-di-GMP phosphodiesterase class II)
MASRVAAAELQSLRYAEDTRRLYRQLQRAICQSLLGLANALEAKDSCTRGHSERVGTRARRIAAALGLPPDEIDIVTQAALLHDIGKIGVPESVLRKRGALDQAEWTLLCNHPLIGAQIVAPFDFFAGGALVIRHHHERWDGSGYPDGLAGAAIPLGARIVAVADVFDALTSDRPYRSALGRDAALLYLTDEAGRTLDPDVVAVLLGLVRVGELG